MFIGIRGEQAARLFGGVRDGQIARVRPAQ